MQGWYFICYLVILLWNINNSVIMRVYCTIYNNKGLCYHCVLSENEELFTNLKNLVSELSRGLTMLYNREKIKYQKQLLIHQ